MNSAYTQHAGKVLAAGSQFKHVMALALNPLSKYTDGLVRCITSREGELSGVRGHIDRSVLYKVNGTLERFDIGERATIKNEEETLVKLDVSGLDYLGLEDPDLWFEEKTGLLHMYCTIPYISRDKEAQCSLIHLGHAVGRNLDSLEMTPPVLLADKNQYANSRAKEVSIAPLNSQGFRYNLFESHDKPKENGDSYSIVRVVIAKDMGKAWEFGETAFHPAEHNTAWIGGHASPGPLLPRSFIDLGENKLVGIINGREANKHVGDKILYGIFSVGLFIYDYEKGKIDWVSPEPFIQDTEAKIITFASQFVETGKDTGILYAHVDDSFVRAYTLSAEGIHQLLPK